MNNLKVTNLSISIAVKEKVKERHRSVRACADAFNLKHSSEIMSDGWKKMDKDFVQRICTNKFSVVTPRVSNLCAFLDVDLHKDPNPADSVFIKEFNVLETAIQRNPNLVHTLRALLSNVADVLTLNEVKELS